MHEFYSTVSQSEMTYKDPLVFEPVFWCAGTLIDPKGCLAGVHWYLMKLSQEKLAQKTVCWKPNIKISYAMKISECSVLQWLHLKCTNGYINKMNRHGSMLMGWQEWLAVLRSPHCTKGSQVSGRFVKDSVLKCPVRSEYLLKSGQKYQKNGKAFFSCFFCVIVIDLLRLS